MTRPRPFPVALALALAVAAICWVCLIAGLSAPRPLLARPAVGSSDEATNRQSTEVPT